MATSIRAPLRTAAGPVIASALLKETYASSVYIAPTAAQPSPM